MTGNPVRAVAGMAAAVVLGALAACSAGSAAPAAAGQSAQPAGAASTPPVSSQTSAAADQGEVTDACRLLTPGDVRRVTGQAVGRFRPSLPGQKFACLAFNGAIEVNVSVHVSSALVFGLAKPAGTRAVSGIGDKAYCTSLADLHVLRGTTELIVSARTCAQAEALARIALSRL